ncbi:unnamed protein product [Closterium sp. NIES-65]|nr:unnamed protein product [Closterium sp. NIES-65]
MQASLESLVGDGGNGAVGLLHVARWESVLCTCFSYTGFRTADSHPCGAGTLFTQVEDADVVEVPGMFAQAEAEVHGMFTHAEVHGMFTQAEVHGMLTQAEVHGILTQAEMHGMFTQAEAEVHGMLTQAEVHGMLTQAEVHGMLQAKLGEAARCWESGTSKGSLGVCFLKSKQRAKDVRGLNKSHQQVTGSSTLLGACSYLPQGRKREQEVHAVRDVGCPRDSAGSASLKLYSPLRSTLSGSLGSLWLVWLCLLHWRLALFPSVRHRRPHIPLLICLPFCPLVPLCLSRFDPLHFSFFPFPQDLGGCEAG